MPQLLTENQNFSDGLSVCSNCRADRTFVPTVAARPTACTIIAGSSSRIFPSVERPISSFASAVIAVYAASSSSKKNTFLPRYYRATKRLIAAIISAFENVLSIETIARHYNVSGVTAMHYFRCVSPKLKDIPEVLSIDEFKGNA